MNKATVLGGGSWGTALARELANNGVDTTLYIRDESQFNGLVKSGTNEKYLPGVKLPENLKYSSDFYESIKNSKFIVSAVPTGAARETFKKLSGNISKDTIIINVAKGIEQGTLLRISEVSKEILPENPFVALSGPTHAEEVVLDYPSTIVAASEDLDAAQLVQNLFMSNTLRVYTNDDLVGVELAGALKNIIALAIGMMDGMGFGDNTKAALMTRGISEISRLGVRMGAMPSTFFGLAGIGDLIVTCTSMHSRNRRCGILIGQGMSIEEATETVGMVVEGIKTTAAAKQLSEKYMVDMPITNILYQVLYENKKAKDSVDDLMLRDKKHEMEGLFRG